ncbi:AraC family transcriptional regulator [Cellulophaga sp. HaHaR_3_176]|uniref:GyrI-like domain-containing protein n=1 Tax=Cellulophaga sp. HaHaR_3_176 TaxID=1942464 RepID=UPI001C1F83B7|nr:GyrI-like domain-containing protein [Cellulophaga sp. HaHaR_3_176]QWX84168.1 AraC family transcriptional regulator [Cellulophaga sp. HaHaR_3_176]
METTKKEGFTIVGVTVKTTNENRQAAKDIPMLWNEFMIDNVKSKIKNKVDDTVYALYTNYEGDHTKPYTTMIGCKVENLENIPEELTVKIIPEATYAKFIAKGDLTKNVVYDKWLTIWNTNLERMFTTDIEVYNEKAINPKDGEVEIYVAIK